MLSRLVITFLPRSKRLLILWLQSSSAVILEPKKIKVCHWFHCFPIYLPWSDGWPDAMILVFWMLSFKSTFSLSSFTSIKRLFWCSLLSAISIRSLYFSHFKISFSWVSHSVIILVSSIAYNLKLMKTVNHYILLFLLSVVLPSWCSRFPSSTIYFLF